jgi:hypothetical protein
VHREAGELLDLLHEHLHKGEDVVTLADWPAARRRAPRQFLALKTMMLVTPLVLVGGLAFVFRSPLAVLLSGIVWVAMFTVIAGLQLLGRERAKRSREGRSVVVVTDRRLMRIWLDGTGEVQSFALAEEKAAEVVEPVPETVRVLLQVDLGKTSLN